MAWKRNTSSRLSEQKHLCIEYVVTNSLDSITLSPEIDFSVSPGNDDMIYRPDPVANLGLINPQVGEGPRIVDWFWLSLPAAAPSNCAMFLYDPVSESRMRAFQLFAGQRNIYRKGTNLQLPPGSYLQMVGFPAGSASAASPIRLRLGISIPDQRALMESIAANLDLAGYAPDNKSVRTIATDTTLDVDSTYGVVTAVATVTLPPSSEAYFWGQSFGGTPRRIGRRYELDIQTPFGAVVAPSPGDTINGSTEPITVSNFVVITNIGDGNWRLHDLAEVP